MVCNKNKSNHCLEKLIGQCDCNYPMFVEDKMQSSRSKFYWKTVSTIFQIILMQIRRSETKLLQIRWNDRIFKC